MSGERSVLVTGASSGFGRGMALRLARDGWRVFATMRAAGRGDELRSAAAAYAERIEVLELDVGTDARATSWLQRLTPPWAPAWGAAKLFGLPARASRGARPERAAQV